MKENWCNQTGKGSFIARCPLTGREVSGEDYRGFRYPSTKTESSLVATAPSIEVCPFCVGNEKSQLPELTRLVNSPMNLDDVVFTDFMMPHLLSQVWVARAFPNLYKNNNLIQSRSLEAHRERYIGHALGREHINSLLNKLKMKGIQVDEDYFFDFGHILIVGTPDHPSSGLNNPNGIILEDIQSALELLTAVHVRKLAYESDEKLFGFIYRNLGRSAAATQPHEHLQMRCYKYNQIPKKLNDQLTTFRHNPTLMNEIVAFAKNQQWIIYESDDVVGFTVPWEEFPGAWLVYTGENPFLSEVHKKDILGFSNALQFVLRKLITLGETSINFGIFDTIPHTELQIPIHAKIVTRRKIRGSTDIFIGPEKHFINPKQLAEMIKDA